MTMYALIRNLLLPVTLIMKALKKISNVMNLHFDPAHSVIVGKYNFNNRHCHALAPLLQISVQSYIAWQNIVTMSHCWMKCCMIGYFAAFKAKEFNKIQPILMRVTKIAVTIKTAARDATSLWMASSSNSEVHKIQSER